MYALSDPPYLLLVVGFFIGISCGLSFQSILKEKVQEWSKSRSSRIIAELQGFRLLLPYFGICLGVCVFLAAGLEMFSMVRWLAYAIALPLTLLMGLLIWLQFGKLLAQLEKGGSRALDLDIF